MSIPRGNKFVCRQGVPALGVELQEHGRTVSFTNGCLDLFHAGHLSTLLAAAAQGDVLLVAVNTDTSIRRLKGPDRPFRKLAERLAIIAALECVDYVTTFETEEELLQLISSSGAHSITKGEDSGPIETIPGHDIVKRVVLAPRVDCQSTTQTAKKLDPYANIELERQIITDAPLP